MFNPSSNSKSKVDSFIWQTLQAAASLWVLRLLDRTRLATEHAKLSTSWFQFLSENSREITELKRWCHSLNIISPKYWAFL